MQRGNITQNGNPVRKRAGFSMVELVSVIIIVSVLAAAIFVGGSTAIRKTQETRVKSDLRNFSIAIESYMFSDRKPVNLTASSAKSEFDSIADSLNKLLPADYAVMKETSIPTEGNIYSTLTGQIVYQSAKQDPWGNPYYLLMDSASRNQGDTEYYFTVLSAGQNAKANVGGEVDKDDIFLISQYTNGTVESHVYAMRTDKQDATGSPLKSGETTLSSLSGKETPRNIGKNAKDIPHEHTMTVVSLVEATCAAAGRKTLRCTICGATEQKVLNQLNHAWTIESQTAATCTASGSKTLRCTTCGATDTKTLSPSGHSWNDGEITLQPTETTEGNKRYTCKKCGQERDEPIPVTQKAYAMLYTDGTMVFQKGSNPDSTKNLLDKYTGFENTTYSSYGSVPWYAKMASITSVSFKDEIKPVSTAYWFYGASKMTSFDTTNLNTSAVTSMTAMFYDCQKLTSLDVSSFNTSKVTTMQSMFQSCSKLTSLDVSSFNTSKVTDMKSMFNGCSGLTSLDLSNFNTRNVTNMYYMFYGCKSLTSLNLSSFNTSKVTTMQSMFSGCSGLTILDVSRFDTSKVTNMSQMFYNCSGLTSLNVSNFNTSNVTNMSGMFYNCQNLTSLDLSNFDTSKVTTLSSMFYNCQKITNLDVSSFDTSKVTTLSSVFQGCRGLTSLNVSNFNTSKVTDMSTMFYGCSGLTSLDLSSLNTSNVASMSSMFSGCNGLTSLDLSSLNTSKVTNMSTMFRSCSRLPSLDLSSFNTSNVTTMQSMFSGCSGLTSLDLSSFNTSNVTNMSYMFNGCSKLASLDLSNFNTSRVTNMYRMFKDCSKLTTIYASSDTWSTAAVTDSWGMFNNCTSLKGGNGTTYNSSYIDKTYARIDNTPDTPGYFTQQAA